MSSPSSVERLDAIINRVRTLSSTNSSAPASNATPAPAVKRTHPAQGASSNNRPAAPAASATPTAFVGTDPFDVAWFPAVPDGHSAFSWGGDEETISASSSAPAAAAASPSAEIVKPQAPPSKVSKESEKKPQESKAAKQEQAPKQGGDKKGKDGAQKQGKQQQPKKAEETKAPENSQAPFTRVEFRVGKIISAEKHPNADKMFVEQIDVGESQPRQICSGLVGLVPLEELANAMVVVVANLKPADLRGKMSAGMILAASTADGVKASLVLAPAGSKVGERVYLHNASEEDRKLPVDASVDIKDKKNPWAAVAPDLKTNENGEVVFKDAKLVTSSGPLKSALSGCRVK